MADKATRDVDLMDQMFRFNVGDIVSLKSQNELYVGALSIFPTRERFGERASEPPPFVIVQRFAVECTAGVQKMYEIRLQTGEIRSLNEIELVPYSECLGNAVTFAQRPVNEEM